MCGGHVGTNPSANMIRMMINLFDVIIHKSPIYMKYLTLIKGQELDINYYEPSLCKISLLCGPFWAHDFI